MGNAKITAIVLSAGKGSRMGKKVYKQYIELQGKVVLAHTLDAFEQSDVDEIVLVVGEGETAYVQEEIVQRYGYQKIVQIVTGGRERYDSVYRGLCAGTGEYVLIHDGARAFITPALINQCIEEVKQYDACVMAVPVKDTIKMVDEKNYAVSTPDRRTMWQMQTPQCFHLKEIWTAYKKMLDAGDSSMTDDAMVMEQYGNRRVKMTKGSYDNIKITTPDDLIIGEAILHHRQTPGDR